MFGDQGGRSGEGVCRAVWSPEWGRFQNCIVRGEQIRTHEALNCLGVGRSDRPGDSSGGWDPEQPPRAATAAATGLPSGAPAYPLLPRLPGLGSSVSTSPRAPSLVCLRGGGSVAAALPPDPALLPNPLSSGGTARLQSGHPEGGRPQSRPGSASSGGGSPSPPRAGRPRPASTPEPGSGRRRRTGLAMLRLKESIPLPLHPYSYPLAPPSIIHQNNRAAIFERDHVTPPGRRGFWPHGEAANEARASRRRFPLACACSRLRTPPPPRGRGRGRGSELPAGGRAGGARGGAVPWRRAGGGGGTARRAGCR